MSVWYTYSGRLNWARNPFLTPCLNYSPSSQTPTPAPSGWRTKQKQQLRSQSFLREWWSGIQKAEEPKELKTTRKAVKENMKRQTKVFFPISSY